MTEHSSSGADPAGQVGDELVNGFRQGKRPLRDEAVPSGVFQRMPGGIEESWG